MTANSGASLKNFAFILQLNSLSLLDLVSHFLLHMWITAVNSFPNSGFRFPFPTLRNIPSSVTFPFLDMINSKVSFTSDLLKSFTQFQFVAKQKI